MTKPQNKSELLTLSKIRFDSLMDFIEQMDTSEQNKDFSAGTLNRNIRDVLMHLHHWHLLFLEWYTVGMSGQKPTMPTKGYTWKTTPELNRWIRERYKEITLEKAQAFIKESFEKVRAIIEAHTDNELFEKKRYQWTGTTSLGAYLISATSSHYDWALRLIKRQQKR